MTETEATAPPAVIRPRLSGPDLIAAAQKYDYDNRDGKRAWTRVPDDQVWRLLSGAIDALDAQPPDTAAVPGDELVKAGLTADRALVVMAMQGEELLRQEARARRAEAELAKIRELAGFWLTVDEDGDIILSGPCADTLGCLWSSTASGERVTLGELIAAAGAHTGEAAGKAHATLLAITGDQP